MKLPREIAYDIVKREGGYVNDPDDLGGATNYGVTIGTMRTLGLDLDGDSDIDVDDVKLVTVDLAVDIFLRHYYEKPRINELLSNFPVKGTRLRSSVFDMFVNSGANSIKFFKEPPINVEEIYMLMES